MNFIKNIFAVIMLGGILIAVIGSLTSPKATSSAPEPSEIAAQKAAKAEETAANKKREQHEDHVSHCMGPDALELNPQVFQAMLNACDRDAYAQGASAEVQENDAAARLRRFNSGPDNQSPAQSDQQQIEDQSHLADASAPSVAPVEDRSTASSAATP